MGWARSCRVARTDAAKEAGGPSMMAMLRWRTTGGRHLGAGRQTEDDAKVINTDIQLSKLVISILAMLL
eukprot:1162127-Pelagomonas_calceolata.AAC.6